MSGSRRIFIVSALARIVWHDMHGEHLEYKVLQTIAMLNRCQIYLNTPPRRKLIFPDQLSVKDYVWYSLAMTLVNVILISLIISDHATRSDSPLTPYGWSRFFIAT